MQLEHSFTVPVGVDRAWAILTDIGSIAGFLPGSTVDGASPAAAEGCLKVKLGPLNVTYRGSARLVGSDAAARRAVIAAQGDAGRNGSAEATVTAVLLADDVTTVELVTELTVTGKPAQFSRSVMLDVGSKIVTQFAAGLAAAIDGATSTSQPDAPTAEVTGTDTTHPVEVPPAAATTPTATDDPTPTATDDLTEPAQAGFAIPAAQAPSVEPGQTGAAPVQSVNGHGSPTPAPPADVRGGLLDTAKPVVVRGLAPVAIAAVVLLGTLRRRRGSRRA